jgi:hypothetical protein
MYEPVNVRAIDRVLGLNATRRVLQWDGNIYDALRSMKQRAVGVTNGIGRLAVIAREAESPPGLMGSRFTGSSGMPNRPPLLRKGSTDFHHAVGKQALHPYTL